jgi:hypothetical protein
VNRLSVTFSILALPLALAASLAPPASAKENVNVQMTLQGPVSDNNPETPFVGVIANGKGHANIIDVDLAAGVARIVGLQVDFDVVLPGTKKKIHYTAHFDNTMAAVTGDPNNPKILFVTANPTSGMVHRSGEGRPDNVLLFATFLYSAGPTVGYSLSFVFTSSDMANLIQVDLGGPA